jgi:hypothetical protein
MNKLSVNITGCIAGITGALVIALIAPAIVAQSPVKKQTSAKPDWPTVSPYDNAICAFDKALTKSARDSTFRDRLLKSSDSARAAVAEVGNINIPNDRVMIFFEAKPGPTSDLIAKAKTDFHQLVKPSNENIHIIALPPLNPNDTTTEYRYEGFFLGEYDEWVRTMAPCNVSQ